MNIFYKANIQGELITLDPVESNHCIKVMRYKRGDALRLIDGRGGLYEAEIVDDDHKACKVSIVSKQLEYEPLPYELHIAIAPTKNIDRFEWFLEKATEIGVTSIVPILTSRSERKNIRLDRLEKVIISAMKQSVKAYLPSISELLPYDNWLMKQTQGSRFIAHCMDGPKIDLWKAECSDSITILIGPEGDFTEDELSQAVKAGFQPASLGTYRLRTETAGVVACSAVYFNMNS